MSCTAGRQGGGAAQRCVCVCVCGSGVGWMGWVGEGWGGGAEMDGGMGAQLCTQAFAGCGACRRRPAVLHDGMAPAALHMCV